MPEAEKHQWPTERAVFTVISKYRNVRYAILDAEFIELIRRKLPNQSCDVVADTLGVSYNTWLKIRRGDPILKSVAERLVIRLANP